MRSVTALRRRAIAAAGPEMMRQPQYQQSEKYYVYGQHGLSQ